MLASVRTGSRVTLQGLRHNHQLPRPRHLQKDSHSHKQGPGRGRQCQPTQPSPGSGSSGHLENRHWPPVPAQSSPGLTWPSTSSSSAELLQGNELHGSPDTRK